MKQTAKINHRASISYLREYFEGMSLSRKYDRNDRQVRAIKSVQVWRLRNATSKPNKPEVILKEIKS
jgi:hypothetical protein